MSRVTHHLTFIFSRTIRRKIVYVKKDIKWSSEIVSMFLEQFGDLICCVGRITGLFDIQLMWHVKGFTKPILTLCEREFTPCSNCIFIGAVGYTCINVFYSFDVWEFQSMCFCKTAVHDQIQWLLFCVN